MLGAWYIPSWSGDLRLEMDAQDPKRTILTIEKPTEAEKVLLAKVGEELARRGWADADDLAPPGSWPSTRRVTIGAALEVVGPVVASIARPGPAVLTALRLSDGKVITITGTDLGKLLVKAGDSDGNEEDKPAQKEEEKPAVAVTVKRPTPCCPQCTIGAVGPASQVLLSFLSDEEHVRWARHRFLIVQGGTSGHRYVLAHRKTELAARIGRICYDLDDEEVMHFHDMTVPPEEEVLAAKLILEHREPWLRNEATALGLARRTDVFKNPFGDIRDGVADSIFTAQIGMLTRHVLPVLQALHSR